MNIFEKYCNDGIELKNRIVVAPMCMNSAYGDGKANNFHVAHYGSLAIGGAGLITLESTAVDKDGRIYEGDIGLWSDDQVEPLKMVVDIIHRFGAKVSVQINHAGRKCPTTDEIIAPSAIAFSDRYALPREMTQEDIDKTVRQFADSAKRAVRAGADAIEIHGAHGYLINQFLSPLSNKRMDSYGGNYEGRAKFLKEVIKAVKREIKEDMMLILRVSAMDFKEGGNDAHEMAKIIKLVKEDLDFVHVSTGGVVRDAVINPYPMYQVEYSKIIKEEAQVKTIAVGLINNKEQAQKIIDEESADLVALGRAMLRNPNWVYAENPDMNIIPDQIKRGFE